MLQSLTLKVLVGAALLFALAHVATVARPQASLSSVFDHFTTAFPLDGAHQFAECESCHVDGMFSGTPLECRDCHSQRSRIRATAQPAKHLPTSEHCESCHRTNGWVPVARVDHLEVNGSCFACHNGTVAMGKPVDHIPAPNFCEDCHRVGAWLSR
jgi:hypothetical protein